MGDIQTHQILYLLVTGVFGFAVLANAWGICARKIPHLLLSGTIIQMVGLIVWGSSFCLKAVALSYPLPSSQLPGILGVVGALTLSIGSMVYSRQLRATRKVRNTNTP